MDAKIFSARRILYRNPGPQGPTAVLQALSMESADLT